MEEMQKASYGCRGREDGTSMSSLGAPPSQHLDMFTKFQKLPELLQLEFLLRLSYVGIIN